MEELLLLIHAHYLYNTDGDGVRVVVVVQQFFFFSLLPGSYIFFYGSTFASLPALPEAEHSTPCARGSSDVGSYSTPPHRTFEFVLGRRGHEMPGRGFHLGLDYVSSPNFDAVRFYYSPQKETVISLPGCPEVPFVVPRLHDRVRLVCRSWLCCVASSYLLPAGSPARPSFPRTAAGVASCRNRG